MFAGTDITLRIYAPTLDTQITRPATATVSEVDYEFYDASFYDISGDPYNVVAAAFDVHGSIVTYRVLESGHYSNVDDDTGFNGYEITFDLLKTDPHLSLMNARIMEDYNTLELPDEFVTFTANKLRVNVDNYSFSTNEMISVVLDIKYAGDSGRDVFSSGEGNDLILGGGGADILFGGAGNDRIKGGAGNDLIEGGAGADRLWGNKGNDTFVLSLNGQRDKIMDYGAGDSFLIQTTADSFDDLRIVQKGDDVLIASDRASFLVLDTDLSDITANDFIF